MELIADGLMIATALTAGLYCLVLGRRLRRLSDAGGGIGAQIAALDASLAETRAALAETRSGVSELRSSTRDSAVRLSDAAAQGDAIAARVERGISEARAVLQQLYEAGDRLGAGRTGDASRGRAQDLPSGSDEQLGTEGDGDSDGDPGGRARPPRRKVALPDPDPHPAPPAALGPAEGDRDDAGGAGGRDFARPRGNALRAERMML